MAPSQVGVVIVNWNETECTLRCLRSLAASADVSLLPVVVDNASPQDPEPALRAEFPDVRIVRLGRNRGFAAGCNAGATAALDAGADQLLFLNNDTQVELHALATLVAAGGRHPATILAPKIVYADEPARVWSAGGVVERPWMINRHVGEGEPAERHGESRRVDWASGCALFVSAETFRRLGPFDESYFMYLEDLDWCLRGARLGIETWLVADAVVRHEVSASAGRLPKPSVLYYGCRNTYRVAFRHNAGIRRVRMAASVAVTVGRLGLRNAFWPGRRTDPLYRARTRAILDFVRGRAGPLMAPEP
jgi:GT2 family glycosyltransferase